MNIQFTDNSREVLTAMLEAKMLAPVDTGNLRNSITHEVAGDTAYIEQSYYMPIS